jgi:hypothetical protein
MTIKEGDFYPKQQNYWERANDNLAGWLGLQHLTTLDVFILLPLIPLIALPVVFWFPWENWFWQDEDAQTNRRRLPAVLRIRVVALSCALVAGITCRNFRCRTVRHSSEGRQEDVGSMTNRIAVG